MEQCNNSSVDHNHNHEPVQQVELTERDAQSQTENAQKELFEAFGLGELFVEERELRERLEAAVTSIAQMADGEMIQRKIMRECAAMDEESGQLAAYIEAVTHEMHTLNVSPHDEKARNFLFKAGMAQRILLDRNIEKLKELYRLIAPSKKSKKA